MDGKPVLIDGSSPGEVWGYVADQKEPCLLMSADGPSGALLKSAVPLSPLFTLATPRSQMLVNAGINPDTPAFVGVLPPLFREGTAKSAKAR
jgi:hypothetical protein